MPRPAFHGKRRGVIVAVGALATAAIAGGVMLRHCGPEVGKPESARMGTDAAGRVTIALVDGLSRESGDVARTLILDARNGHILREQEGDGSALWHDGAPRCSTVQDIDSGATHLHVLPYYDHYLDADQAEAPAGTVTIPPAAQPIGFLADDRRNPLALGGDAILNHMQPLGSAPTTGALQFWLTRVDAQGKPRWSVPLTGACQLATIVEDLLVVAVEDGRRRALGIDLATGAIRWRLRL